MADMNNKITSDLNQLESIIKNINKSTSAIINQYENIQRDAFGGTIADILRDIGTATATGVGGAALFAYNVKKGYELISLANKLDLITNSLKNASTAASASSTTSGITNVGGQTFATAVNSAPEITSGVTNIGGQTVMTSTASAGAQTTALANTAAGEGLVTGAGGLTLGATITITIGTIAALLGFTAGYKIGSTDTVTNFLQPKIEKLSNYLTYDRRRKKFESDVDGLKKDCVYLESKILASISGIKTAIEKLEASKTKLKDQQYPQIKKRKKKIQKRINELQAIQQQMLALNQSLGNSYKILKGLC